jgi:hypothetical protein
VKKQRGESTSGDAADPKYTEMLHRRGYRFVAPAAPSPLRPARFFEAKGGSQITTLAVSIARAVTTILAREHL